MPGRVKKLDRTGPDFQALGGKFIDQNYAKRMGFKTHKLEKPLQAYNVDGTEKK